MLFVVSSAVSVYRYHHQKWFKDTLPK